MSLPTGSAASLRVLGCVLILFHFASVIRAALEVGDPIGPYLRPRNEMPCDNLDSYHVTESNCDKFWICLSQVKVSLSCGSDMSFYAQTGECKPYSMVPGCINGTSTAGSMQYHNPSIPAAEDVRAIVRQYFGRVHDKSGSGPATGDLVVRNPTPIDPTLCTGVASFRVLHSNCNRFWICLNEHKRGLYCPPDTSFHAGSGECKQYSMVPGCTDGIGEVGYMQHHNPPIVARGNVVEAATKFLGPVREISDLEE